MFHDLRDFRKYKFEEVSSRLAVFRVSRNAVLRKSQALWPFFGFPEIAQDGDFEEVSSRLAVLRVSRNAVLRKSQAVWQFSGFPEIAQDCDFEEV